MLTTIFGRQESILFRFSKVFLMIALVAFCTGCSKSQTATPTPPPDDPKDIYGVPLSQIDYVYLRDTMDPSHPIRIDFLHASTPEGDFTDAEKALLIKALEAMPTQMLINLDLHVFEPNLLPDA